MIKETLCVYNDNIALKVSKNKDTDIIITLDSVVVVHKDLKKPVVIPYDNLGRCIKRLNSHVKEMDTIFGKIK